MRFQQLHQRLTRRTKCPHCDKRLGFLPPPTSCPRCGRQIYAASDRRRRY